MRRLIRARWSHEEDERLKTLVASGASALRAAGAFKCSVSVIRGRAWKLGCPFPSIREAKKRRAERETAR
jgi:GcrA cell cycle regulator